jgi:hypothetical protein
MICNFRQRIELEYRANLEAFYRRRLKKGMCLLPEDEIELIDATGTLAKFANNGWAEMICDLRKKAKKRMKKRYPNG